VARGLEDVCLPRASRPELAAPAGLACFPCLLHWPSGSEHDPGARGGHLRGGTAHDTGRASGGSVAASYRP